jgi:hypothetical protein
LARVGLAAALIALVGCASPDVRVTVTAPAASPGASAAASAANPGNPTPSAPAKPSTPAKPAPATTTTPAPLPTVGPGGATIVVTQGPVAPECTHTVCYVVHVAWKNLDPGPHDTQCVTDHGTLATWSQSTYNYPTADGERDLGCFLGYPGSHVWVVLDGTLESAHADWG